MVKSPIQWFAIALIAAVVFAALSPLEKTLGANARFVYFHGAWVWTGMIGFTLAALIGLAALLNRRAAWQRWSQAWGRAGLFFWITFLPMSLWAMQANWGGLFLDEPRWQIPFNLAIVGLLLQIGLSFLPLPWTCAGNLLFGLLFFFGMRGSEAVLHPESPIFNSEAGAIQFFFFGLVVILTLAAWQLARALQSWQKTNAAPTPAPGQ